jgi:hypothetical protein
MAVRVPSFAELPCLFLGRVAACLSHKMDVVRFKQVCQAFRLLALEHSKPCRRLSFCTRAWGAGGGVQGFVSTLQAVASVSSVIVHVRIGTSAPEWCLALRAVNGWGAACELHVTHDLATRIPVDAINSSTNLASFDSIHTSEFDGVLLLPRSCSGARFGYQLPGTPQPYVRQLILRHMYVVEVDEVVDSTMVDLRVLFPLLEVLHLGNNEHVLLHARCPSTLRVLVVDVMFEGVTDLEERMPGLQTLICPHIEPRTTLVHNTLHAIVTTYEVEHESRLAPPHFANYRAMFPSLSFFWGHGRWQSVMRNGEWLYSDDEDADLAPIPLVWNGDWLTDMACLCDLHLLIHSHVHNIEGCIPVIAAAPTNHHSLNVTVSLCAGNMVVLPLYTRGNRFTPPCGVLWDTSWRNWLPEHLFTTLCERCGVHGMPALQWGS